MLPGLILVGCIFSMEGFTFEKWLQNGYNQYCLRETNTYQEVNQMCNFDCSTIWQILCRLFGFGC